MNNKVLKLLKRSEKKLIDQISLMSRKTQPVRSTREFLLDLMNGLRDKSIDIRDYCFMVRIFVLQPVTRDRGKRRAATDMLIKLLSYIGRNESAIFRDYINNIEKRLNKDGRSYFHR